MSFWWITVPPSLSATHHLPSLQQMKVQSFSNKADLGPWQKTFEKQRVTALNRKSQFYHVVCCTHSVTGGGVHSASGTRDALGKAFSFPCLGDDSDCLAGNTALEMGVPTTVKEPAPLLGSLPLHNTVYVSACYLLVSPIIMISNSEDDMPSPSPAILPPAGRVGDVPAVFVQDRVSPCLWYSGLLTKQIFRIMTSKSWCVKQWHYLVFCRWISPHPNRDTCLGHCLPLCLDRRLLPFCGPQFTANAGIAAAARSIT